MGQFQVDKKKDGTKMVVSLSGSIDEDAILTNITFDGASEVVLDLDKVSAINSCGIREWIKWLKTASTGAKVVYRNCPKIIVDQINMVSGFLPDNGTVESFYVPYFNENAGTEKMVLFKAGSEFKNGDVHPPDEVKDEKGESMEMDVIEAKYFKFIKKSA
ncbi:MAG: STAS domain-containing protein [Bdellovibrionales bacterium]